MNWKGAEIGSGDSKMDLKVEHVIIAHGEIVIN